MTRPGVDLPPYPSYAGCRVIPNGGVPKRREYITILGITARSDLGVYNSNIVNTKRALDERYIFCDVGGGLFEPRLSVEDNKYNQNQYLRQFRNEVAGRLCGTPVISESEVVLMYSGRKRTIYQQAHESLCVDPLTKRDSRLNMFIKFEKQKLTGAPRVIQPRSVRYNLRLGTYLKHTEHPFFRSINKAFGARTKATVIKGFNNIRVASILHEKWMLFKSPVAVGLDAKKFDMHVTKAALKWEHSHYTRVFPHKELRKLLKWQLVNQGTAYCSDGKLKFSMEGTRCSGDMNTSLGNCIIMCGLVYAYTRMKKVNVELANNGDDCVVFMEEEDLARFMEGLPGWFATYGFRMAVEKPVREFEEVEFCQSHPIKTVEGWKMMRSFTSVLMKDGICLLAIQNLKVLKKWMGGVGMCNMAAHRGVPVLQSMAEWYMRNGSQCPRAMLQRMFENTSMLNRVTDISSKKLVVSDDARASFYFATGVLPDMQLYMEQYFNNLKFDATIYADRELAGVDLPCWFQDCVESPALIQW